MRPIVPTLCAGMFAAVCAAAAAAQVASTAVNPPDAAPAAPASAFPTVRIVPANAPPPGGRPAGNDANELVCKTSLVTGSLVARQRTCLTRKQWAYVNDAHEDEARKMMMDNMGKPNGN